MLIDVIENGGDLPLSELSGFFIISMLSSLLIIMGVTIIVDICSKEEQANVQQTFTIIARKLVPAIITWLLYSVLTVLGSFLFIVPGLVVGVLGFFAIYSISLSNQNPIEALIYSKDLIIGNWWKVFANILVIAISNILIVAIANIPLAYVSDSELWNTIININNSLIGSFFYVIYAVMFINYRNVFESRQN